MTEPTRDALHAETLHYLEFQRDDKLRIDANRAAMGMVPSPAWKRDAEMYAYAAACVKRVPELETLAEFRRCELEAVRIENLGVRAENRRLEAEVERLRADADLMRWLFDEMGGGFTHDEESYGMMCGKWGKWPDDWRDALHKARAAYAAATREGTDAG